MRVLITRAEPDGRAFADQCRAAGFESVLAPVMRIDIAKAEIGLGDIGALAFTSANGVRAFAANSGRRDLPVYAVGLVTAAAAQAAGFAKIFTAGGDVNSLADYIASESAFSPKALLHIAGEDRAGDLVALLSARGIAARRQTLYAAKPVETLSVEAVTALKRGEALWVTLFSPRTASLFLSLVDDEGLTKQLAGARAVCLSEAVADAASKAHWAAVDIAAERTAEGVLKLFAGQRRGA